MALDAPPLARPSITGITQEVREAHEAYQVSHLKAITQAIRAGRALIRAQTELGGGYREWLSTSFKFSERTAQVYVQLAEHESKILANAQHAADLTLRGALRLIAVPKPEKEERPALAQALFEQIRLDELEQELKQAKAKHIAYAADPDRMLKLCKIVRLASEWIAEGAAREAAAA